MANVIKWLLIVVVCIASSNGYSGKEQYKYPLKASDKIKDWKKATYNEKLAICIGLAVVSNKSYKVKLTAKDFYNCIDTATSGLPQTDEFVIFDLARLCEKEMRK